MKENWINDMKRKLEGHKMAPPPGLWEDISKQMDKPFGLKPLSRLTGTAQRYWAAAAAVLAFVGFFVFQNGNDGEQPQQASAISQQPVSEQQVPEQSASQSLAESSAVEQEPQAKAPLLALARHQAPVAESETETREVLPESDSPAEALQMPDEPKQTSADSQQTPAESQEISVEPQQTENFALRAENFDNLPIVESDGVQASNKWSLGLNASGGLLAANTSLRMDRLYFYHSLNSQNDIGEKGDIDKNSNYTSQISPYTITEYVSKHHLPIRFGLSVQYQLNNHLALHSGISYTRLNSEFSIPLYPNIHYDQKLHYLGVPLGVTWQLWATNRFRFYLSGGTMVEKCVSADLEGSGKVSTKPWQWSVNAAAGAEYAFTRHLGFYLEPSLGYYFDDGTSLEHYYKEHPLAPSIEFGLRLHLNE